VNDNKRINKESRKLVFTITRLAKSIVKAVREKGCFKLSVTFLAFRKYYEERRLICILETSRIKQDKTKAKQRFKTPIKVSVPERLRSEPGFAEQYINHPCEYAKDKERDRAHRSTLSKAQRRANGKAYWRRHHTRLIANQRANRVAFLLERTERERQEEEKRKKEKPVKLIRKWKMIVPKPQIVPTIVPIVPIGPIPMEPSWIETSRAEALNEVGQFCGMWNPWLDPSFEVLPSLTFVSSTIESN
jgi:hypothetical protein